MKRILVLSTLTLALAGGAAFAQDTAPSNPPAAKEGHGKHGPKAQLAQMKENLNLTDDQASKIEPLLNDRAQKLHAIKTDTSLTEDQKRMKAKDVVKDFRTSLDSILTPEQQSKMKMMKGKAKAAPAADNN